MEPTNVLVIMSDEHRREILGAYGNAQAYTPNLDALAESGARFDAAYCNFPICVPSRASFVTGRYVHDIDTWDNAAPYTGQAPSWGRRLADAGHHVTTIGKLHFRNATDDTGFADQRMPMHVKDGVGDLFGCLRPDVPRIRNALGHVRTSGAGGSDYLRYDRQIGDAAVDWLRGEASQHERPWCLWVSFALPHFPFIAPPEDVERFDPATLPLPTQWEAADWPDHPHIAAYRADRMQDSDEQVGEAAVRRTVAAYYGMCAYLDRQVGRVLTALRASGQADRTRIVYTSDHGEMLGDYGLWGKNVMYEGAAAIPLILAGPGVASGTAVEAPVSLVDLFPTIVEGTDAPLPDADADLPGTSLWPAADGGNLADRPVFAEYHASGSHAAVFMLRRGRHKYVHHVGYRPQLFDLESDPHERHDLAPHADQSRPDGQRRSAEDIRTTIQTLESELRDIVNPEAVDRAAKADQQRRLDLHGGAAAIRAAGSNIPYTPPPDPAG